MFRRILGGVILVAAAIMLAGCYGLVPQLVVTEAGGGTGTVVSNPAGINCPGTCSHNFGSGVSQVTLTAAPAAGFGLGGWQDATTGVALPGCSANSTTCSVSANARVQVVFNAGLQSINHIIFLAQENRSFDNYFGAMRQYWAQNNIPDQSFDGLPQFNPATGPAPNTGPAPSIPGCDPLFPYPPNSYCQIDAASPAIQSFHMQSTCVENPSPSWGESHRDWNVNNPVDPQALMNGFVDTAANDGRQYINKQGVLAPYYDTNGIRAMGYYDGNDLNYYYALASTFATSDRWFSPVMTRTPPNRDYLIAGTSHGYAYQIGANPPYDSAVIPNKTIFEVLSAANPPISWKIYVPTLGTPCQTDTSVGCLINFTYIHDFQFGANVRANPSAYANNIVPISQFYTDAINGTLPQVAQIEPASSAGLDEHPEDDDPAPGTPACCSMQAGAAYVSTLINAVMCGQNAPPSGSCTPGPSWGDSVFILTFDEFGGFYDHVPPQPTVSPDGIPPVDLFPYDPCYQNPGAGPTCDFTYTGYRVPLVVISPFAKKNFVSHQVRDATAILKLIETRFNLPALTARDAAQTPMDDITTGFFDFSAPFKTPPSNLPQQNDYGASACYVNPPPTSP